MAQAGGVDITGRVAIPDDHLRIRFTHPTTTNTNVKMSAVTATTFKASTFTAGRVSLRAKNSAVAAKPRGMTVMAYKVTLETPEGTQEIECADDTYVLDAAEVRLVDLA
jgi:hypothetical protein